MNPSDYGLLERLRLRQGALAGQTAVITGAARGIGEHAAHLLAQLGATAIVADRAEGGAAVAEAIKQSGGDASYFRCDVARPDDIARLVQQVLQQHGRVDILINNAMFVPVAPLVELSLEDWEATVATNLRAAFLTIKHLLPGMLQRRRGVIVNMIAYEGSPFTAGYSATKMGLRSLALTVARETGPNAGVSSFSFLPGLVDTPGLQNLFQRLAARLGITTEALISQASNRPGRSGLLTPAQCAAGLAYSVVHAAEYHGQVADPFEPLGRYGIIETAPTESLESEALEAEISLPQHVRRYISDVSETNRELEQRIQVRTHELVVAHKQSEDLLLNILPKPIAERLKQGESTIADRFEAVSVLFADIVDFTPLSARLPPERLVELLDAVFSAFDQVAQRHALEKIKTIGDCYMLVGGLPEPRADHAEKMALAALEIRDRVRELGQRMGVPLTVRVGMHVGAVVAGVIGKKKFIYDLWGDTVNTASRMESQSLADRIQCTEEVYALLRERFSFESRGALEVKGKGMMQTYFLTGVASRH